MSETRALDRIADLLALDAQHPEGFEEHFGKNAVAFFVELPWVFRLLRRVAFDLDLERRDRHVAGMATLYIAEHQDFLDDERQDQHGLIDDVWIAYRALTSLADSVGVERMQRHWKGETSLVEVVGMGRNLPHLTDQLPTKVQQKASEYLGID